MSKNRSQPSQRVNELKLWRHKIDNEGVSKLPHKIEAGFRLALHTVQWVTGGEEVRNEVAATVPRKSDVPCLVGFVERAPDHRAASPNMLRPRAHVGSEEHRSAGLETL